METALFSLVPRLSLRAHALRDRESIRVLPVWATGLLHSELIESMRFALIEKRQGRMYDCP